MKETAIGRHTLIAVSLALALVMSLALVGSAASLPVPQDLPPRVQVTAEPTTRVSVSSAGEQVSGWNDWPSISANGRFVTFQSTASGLVGGHSPHWTDVFLHDAVLGTTELVSLNSAGEPADWGGYMSSITPDGRYVAFYSYSTNLGPEGSRGFLFVRDRLTETTDDLGVGPGGELADDPVGEWQWRPAISADGRFVAFTSGAGNLDPRAPRGSQHVFVRDRATRSAELVSVNSAGEPGDSYSFQPAISADGRFVAFVSNATNLVPGVPAGGVFLHDRVTRSTVLASVDADGQLLFGAEPAISADGRFVAFLHSFRDESGQRQYHLRVFDRTAGTSTLASLDPYGSPLRWVESGWTLSADGRFVAFSGPSLAFDWRSHAFIRDMAEGETRVASVSSDGELGNRTSRLPAISPDGRSVAFASDSFNLVPGDTNERPDIFVRALDSALPPLALPPDG